MAECSFTRCIQQRRFIRKQLRKWTTNMVHIVGLERLAEELMGQKKWQLYRESMANNQEICNNNLPNISDKHNNNIDGNEHGDQDREQDIHDWSPNTQCQFCADGVLGHDHNGTFMSPQASDCDSSDSDLESAPTLLNPSSLYESKNINNLFGKHFSSNNLNSMATSLATVSALNNSTSLFPNNWYFSQFPKHFPLNHSNSLSTSGSVNEMNRHFTEQPLDLSAKNSLNSQSPDLQQPLQSQLQQPSPNQQQVSQQHTSQIQKLINPGARLSTPNFDNRHIFKAKPRMSSVAGRRTYTEDELQAALRDIQSGKLGTRRAAVIYGIPRSTLRNKVYKLAMEREKETLLSNQNAIVDLKPTLKIEDDDEMLDEDKDLSGAEDEKEVEKALQQPLITIADILRFSNLNNEENLRNLLQKCHESQEFLTSINFEHNPLGPFLQSLLLSGKFQQNPHHSEQQLNDDLHTKTTSSPTPQSVIVKNENVISKSQDINEKDEESCMSNVILKIPSFRPSSTTSTSMTSIAVQPNLNLNVSSNNEIASTSFRNSAESSMVLTSPITSDSSPIPSIMNSATAITPTPTPTQTATPSIPNATNKNISLRDVIARSINQNYPQSSVTASESLKTIEMDFKRQFAAPPLAILNNHNHSDRNFFGKGFNTSNSNVNNPNNSQGGKGTRPKRGKYRNYDRDSLVEAVRAVQRGEMSVHRAGSYYGVPHSTLEYKVKERHLMRPRKRDPKPSTTNLDEKSTSSTMASNKNIPVDKSKQQITPNLLNKPTAVQKFSPTTSPNGIKMFEPTTTPMNYVPPQFPFWHPSFHNISMDYGRNSSNHPHSHTHPTPQPPPPPPPSFPINTEQFFNAQMLHKLQQQQETDVQIKSNNLTNIQEPSILDGIIRSSLETNPKPYQTQNLDTTENKVLLEQLCRNSNRLTPQPTNSTNNYLQEPNSSSNDSFQSSKRNTSPKHSPQSDSPLLVVSNNNNNERVVVKEEIESDELSNHVPLNNEHPNKTDGDEERLPEESVKMIAMTSSSNNGNGSSEFFANFKKDNNAMYMEKNGLFETAKVCASESNFDLVQD